MEHIKLAVSELWALLLTQGYIPTTHRVLGRPSCLPGTPSLCLVSLLKLLKSDLLQRNSEISQHLGQKIRVSLHSKLEVES